MIPHRITSANPKYPTLAEDLKNVGWPSYGADVSRMDLYIFCKQRVSERNHERLFVMLLQGPWLGRKVPIMNRDAVALASRQPLCGDPIRPQRECWDSYDNWRHLIHSEWEATLDEAWIVVLIALQARHPAPPHVRSLEQVKRNHPAYLTGSAQLELFK